MVNEFSEVAKLLDALGVKAIFAPILSILLLLFLTKKYIFGGGATFLKDAIKEWLADQREKIKAEVQVWEKLKDIDEKFSVMQEALWDQRRYQEDQIRLSDDIMRQHIAETRNLILILKKKTDKGTAEQADDSLKVDTQYFKGGPNVTHSTNS